jgi:hypothetical protein
MDGGCQIFSFFGCLPDSRWPKKTVQESVEFIQNEDQENPLAATGCSSDLQEDMVRFWLMVLAVVVVMLFFCL